MLEDTLISLVSLLVGLRGMRWYLGRPPKRDPNDRTSGLRRYQDYKAAP